MDYLHRKKEITFLISAMTTYGWNISKLHVYKLRNTFKKVVFQDYSMKFEAKNPIEYISKKLGMKFHHQTFSFIAKNTKLCTPWVNEKRMLVQSNYSDSKFKWMTVLFEFNIFWYKEVKFNNILVVQISLPYYEL